MLIIVCCFKKAITIILCIPKLAMKPKTNVLILFGKRVKELRKEKKISQEELAYRLKMCVIYLELNFMNYLNSN